MPRRGEAAGRRRNFWCWAGLHRWAYPGGDCEECGEVDTLWGPDGG